jgi:lysophospholipase L1-like esterase
MKRHVSRLMVLAAMLGAMLGAMPAMAQQAPAPVLAPEQRPPAAPIRASKIILVGDSTMQARSGWGGSFCASHVTMFAACVNLARGGRSSYSYRAEGSWEVALAEARAPGFKEVWILIQFGHNDQPGKPERSTDLAVEFPENLRRYVREAREAGALPVLLTPLTRRQFKQGKLENDLEPWSAAIRKVAAETGVPLIDLNATSAAAVQAMGPAESLRFAQAPAPAAVAAAAATGTTIPAPAVPPPPAPVAGMPAAPAPARVSFDYTHIGREGADYFAAMVTVELAEKVPGMAKVLVK